MAFDYWSCFKPSRIRNELKRNGYEFSPLEKAYLVYNSNFTFDMKENAFKEIIKDYGDLLLSSENVPTCREVYDLSLGDMLKKYLDDRLKLVMKLKSIEPRTFYKAWYHMNIPVHDRDNETLTIPGYSATYDECIKRAEKFKSNNPHMFSHSYVFYVEKTYLDTIESPYDDSVIYCSYNEKGELLNVEEICSGIIDYPDPDVEFIKQLQFDFLTPYFVKE